MSNTVRSMLTDEVGAVAADVLIQRLLLIRTLAQVGEATGMTPAQVRQHEARAIRTLSPETFTELTAIVQEVRPEFAWHRSVARQRGE